MQQPLSSSLQAPLSSSLQARLVCLLHLANEVRIIIIHYLKRIVQAIGVRQNDGRRLNIIATRGARTMRALCSWFVLRYAAGSCYVMQPVHVMSCSRFMLCHAAGSYYVMQQVHVMLCSQFMLCHAAVHVYSTDSSYVMQLVHVTYYSPADGSCNVLLTCSWFM